MAANSKRHRQKCGFNTHDLDDDHVLLTDPKLIKFLKLANREFRASWPVCRKCANSLELGYRIKLRRARQQYRQRQLPDVSSELSTTSNTESHNETAPTTTSSTTQTPETASAFIEEKLRKAAAARERAKRNFARMQREAIKKYLGQITGG